MINNMSKVVFYEIQSVRLISDVPMRKGQYDPKFKIK